MKPTAVSVGYSDQPRCAPTPVTLTHTQNPVGMSLLPSHITGKLNLGGLVLYITAVTQVAVVRMRSRDINV